MASGTRSASTWCCASWRYSGVPISVAAIVCSPPRLDIFRTRAIAGSKKALIGPKQSKRATQNVARFFLATAPMVALQARGRASAQAAALAQAHWKL